MPPHSRDPENCTVAVGAAFVGRSVKIAVIRRHQGGFGIGTVMTIGERIKRCEEAIGSDAENPTVAIGATNHGGSVKIPVTGLGEPCYRVGAVSTIGEGIKRCQDAIGSDAENRTVTGDVVADAALVGGSIKFAVTGLHQRGFRKGAIMTTGERIQWCEDAISGDAENGAVRVGAAIGGGAVKIAVAGLHQSAPWIGAVMATGERIKRRQYAIGGDVTPSSLVPPSSVVP